MAKTKTTPEPIVVTTICSVCGLGWELHGADPTTDDCIRLLKAELASRPTFYPVLKPVPYPAPYPVPVRPWQPWGPTWYGTPTITCQSNSTTALSYNTPRTIESTCRPVSA